MNKNKKIAIIGAGAAGCFCAINLKRLLPLSQISIFEASNTPLAKLALTGGGRCNLTNTFKDINTLSTVYPRGEQIIKRAFYTFNQEDTYNWFTNENIELYTQEDQRIFPKSDDAMQIVRKLIYLIKGLKIELQTKAKISEIIPQQDKYKILFSNGEESLQIFDIIIVTTGGIQNLTGYNIFKNLNLTIVQPVPSLFTFCIKDKGLNELTGVSIQNTILSLPGTKFKSKGAILVTHKGISGPAVLKLSSYAAIYLSEKGYQSNLHINWIGEKEEEVHTSLKNFAKQNKKNIGKTSFYNLPQRLWGYIIQKAGIPETKKWEDINKTELNKLCLTLIEDSYKLTGKNTNKEEFVTCGGIALSNININTLEAKAHKNLYFAGEILDIDAVTGGFNLQAAWSTGYLVAKSISNSNVE